MQYLVIQKKKNNRFPVEKLEYVFLLIALIFSNNYNFLNIFKKLIKLILLRSHGWVEY